MSLFLRSQERHPQPRDTSSSTPVVCLWPHPEFPMPALGIQSRMNPRQVVLPGRKYSVPLCGSHGGGLRHDGHLSQTIQGNPNTTDKTHPSAWGWEPRKGLTDHGKRREIAHRVSPGCLENPVLSDSPAHVLFQQISHASQHLWDQAKVPRCPLLAMLGLLLYQNNKILIWNQSTIKNKSLV